jgi:hypothetical protein
MMTEDGPDPDAVSRAGRIRETGSSTADAVQHAASVFEEELAAGIAGAERLERRFSADNRIDPEELQALTQRFRSDGHDVIEALAEQIGDVGSQETRTLARRFTADAHSLVDTFANLVNLAPDIVNRLMADRGAQAGGENPGEGDS